MLYIFFAFFFSYMPHVHMVHKCVHAQAITAFSPTVAYTNTLIRRSTLIPSSYILGNMQI